MSSYSEVKALFNLGQFCVLPKLPQVSLEGWVSGFIESGSWATAVEINSTKFTMENDAVALDLPDAGSLFEVAVFTHVEDYSISSFQWGDLFFRWSVET